MCVQYDCFMTLRGGSEDCLYLNVYAKTLDKENKKATMVFIHGGAFYFGNSDDMFYGPDYLIRKDVVLVTINYRLGVFGFLDLENEIAPGNQGLKDQVMALQWIRDNIGNFGGDPENVTIFGESTGGAAVHYLTLSPLSKGLFHKAISQSAVAFSPICFVKNGRKNATELCTLLGKSLSDPKKILEYLKTVDSNKLRDAQEQLRLSKITFPFGPGVDDKSLSPFMPFSAEEMSEKGVHIPYLLGYTSGEGILMLSDAFTVKGLKRSELFKILDENFDSCIDENYLSVLNRHNIIPMQLKRLYYKGKQISEKNCSIYAKFVGELTFIEGIHKLIKIQVNKSSAPTYLYKFSYDQGFSLIKSKLKSLQLRGASHFDDLNYIFKMNLYDLLGVPHLQKGSHDYKVMEQITEMWTNFAKYGKPTIITSELLPTHWLPVVNDTVLRYLNIGEDLTMQSVLNIEEKFALARNIKI
ncbi:esterase FE4-like [Copidosoma floridanum]|uniref:esterase FE4-like n=1 Tax=Copidosoma floridanum TaxID=29053 RepID=UPI000C6F88B9|nr:esterase FE4-like [Copidosoma floridanum]